MSHKTKWRQICRVSNNHDCYNCALKQKIKECKEKIMVTCDIGYGQRTLSFRRPANPFCGAWKA